MPRPAFSSASSSWLNSTSDSLPPRPALKAPRAGLDRADEQAARFHLAPRVGLVDGHRPPGWPITMSGAGCERELHGSGAAGLLRTDIGVIAGAAGLAVLARGDDFVLALGAGRRYW
jgi:hypothetical protein